MAERKVIVEPGQCLEDIALQEYASQDGVRNLLFDNPDILVNGFCTDLVGGMELRILSEPLDKPVYDAMRKLRVIPATNDTGDSPPVGLLGDYNDDHNNDHLINPP